MKTDSWFSDKYYCSKCGSNIVYCQSENYDYFIYCSQKNCDNHVGIEVYDMYDPEDIQHIMLIDDTYKVK